MTRGSSLGPMKTSARTAIIASSAESNPNMADWRGLAGFVVSRRCCRVSWPRSHVDRVARARLVTRQLARRIVAALFLIAADFLVIFIGHALLEALEAFGDVPHHRREAVSSEQKQEDDRKDQDMPDA